MRSPLPGSPSGLVTRNSLPGPQTTHLKRRHFAPSAATGNAKSHVVKPRKAVRETVAAAAPAFLRRVIAEPNRLSFQEKGLPCAAFSLNPLKMRISTNRKEQRLGIFRVTDNMPGWRNGRRCVLKMLQPASYLNEIAPLVNLNR